MNHRARRGKKPAIAKREDETLCLFFLLPRQARGRKTSSFTKNKGETGETYGGKQESSMKFSEDRVFSIDVSEPK